MNAENYKTKTVARFFFLSVSVYVCMRNCLKVVVLKNLQSRGAANLLIDLLNASTCH